MALDNASCGTDNTFWEKEDHQYKKDTEIQNPPFCKTMEDLDSWEEGHSRLVVDLTQVTYVDSAGLAALVSGLKAAREAGGTLDLVGLDGQVLKVLRLTLLDRVIETHSDLETALNAVSKG